MQEKQLNLAYLLPNIQSLCAKKEISLAELERRTGLANGVVRKWDKTSPTLRSASAVADYFGVTLDRLLEKWE